MPLRARTTKGKVHEQAKHLMRNPKFSAREAHGVATGIVTGRKPKKKKKKGRKMARSLGGGGAGRAMRQAAARVAPVGERPFDYGGVRATSPARATQAKRRKRMPKRIGYGGSSHMDRGLSYANAPQGYRSDAGKPSAGHYGPPRQGHINQSGMPNASSMRRMMDYMSNYYGGGGTAGSTNAGTSPNPGSMDSTYRKGQATIPRGKKGMKYA